MQIARYIAAAFFEVWCADWLFCNAALAQTDAVPPAPVIKNTAPTSLQQLPDTVGPIDFFTRGTPYEFWFAVLSAFTGVTIIVIASCKISRLQGVRAEDLSRPIIMIAVITAILLLMVTAYSNEQIAAAFGLLGTLIGNALGRDTGSKPAPDESDVRDGAASAAGNPSKDR